MDRADAIRSAVPGAVASICRTLAAEGYEAYAVGGAVRDALLGQPAGDWDVATSAPPERVRALFRHTIPTGIEHGTVTVVYKQDGARDAVEVTTFRGEVGYSDARRPDEVVFGVSLEDDLARRDFAINAIALEPESGRLVDPFGGRADLERGLVRAVGDPEARLREDGLRVMRALRFVAQLDFELEEATERALPRARSSLSRVARERIFAELKKLLEGSAAHRALAAGRRCGALSASISELGAPLERAAEADWEEALLRARALPRDACLRLAALIPAGAFAPAARAAEAAEPAGEHRGFEDREAGERAEAVMRALKASNAERGRVRELAARRSAPTRGTFGAPEARRLAGAAGRGRAGDLALLWRAEAAIARPGKRAERWADAAEIMDAILRRGDPVAARDLAISGGEVMRALGLSPGPAVGEIMADLVGAVCDEPARNHPEALVALARARAEARGGEAKGGAGS